MIDLMSEARGAVYHALATSVPAQLASVYDDVPEGTQPPFIKVGAIDSEDDSAKGDDVEKLTVEVVAVYRGEDRGVLLAMLFAAKAALHRKAFATDVAVFPQCRWLTSSVSDAGPDGVTYAGLGNFELIGEPA